MLLLVLSTLGWMEVGYRAYIYYDRYAEVMGMNTGPLPCNQLASSLHSILFLKVLGI